MELKNMDGINVSPKNDVEIRQNSLIIASMATAGYPGAEALVNSAAVIEAYLTKNVDIDTLDKDNLKNSLQDLFALGIGFASMLIDQEKKEEPAPEQEPANDVPATTADAVEAEVALKGKKTK